MEKLTQIDKDLLLQAIAHYMPMEMRVKIMDALPGAYNRWMGSEIMVVRVKEVHCTVFQLAAEFGGRFFLGERYRRAGESAQAVTPEHGGIFWTHDGRILDEYEIATKGLVPTYSVLDEARAARAQFASGVS